MEVVKRLRAQKKEKSSWSVMMKVITNDDEVDKLKLNNDEVDK